MLHSRWKSLVRADAVACGRSSRARHSCHGIPPRRLVRAFVFLAGWAALVATTSPYNLAAELGFQGTIPVRNGHGEAAVVIDIDGFYVDERADVWIEVGGNAELASDAGAGPIAATYSLESPDGSVTQVEVALDGWLSGFFVYFQPADHCADPAGCTLTVPIAIDAAPGTDADVRLFLRVSAHGDIWNFDLGPEHIDARLEVGP